MAFIPLGKQVLKGYILVTDSPLSSGIVGGHAGIIRAETTAETIKAMPSGGVDRHANVWDWRYKGQQVWALKIKNKSNAEHKKAANWADQQRYKPYNYNFADRNRTDAFYCSQLVWAAVKNALNIDISNNPFGASIFPMTLLDSLELIQVYYKNKKP